MANIRVKDLPNTDTLVDGDELIVDSSSAGTRRISFGELKSETASDFVAAPSTYKVATLAADNKLDPSQIPDTLTNGLNFVGVANSAPDLVSTTQGDFYVIGTAFGVYSVGDQAVYDGSAYVRVTDGTKQIGEGGTGATTAAGARTNLSVNSTDEDAQANALKTTAPALYFNTSSTVAVADDTKFTFSNGTDDLPFSIEAWVNVRLYTSGFYFFGAWTSNREFLAFLDSNGKLTLGLSDGTNDTYALGSTSVPVNQWTHVCIVYPGAGPNSANGFNINQNGTTMYINGVPETVTPTNNNSYGGLVDRIQSQKIGYGSGHLRAVRVYNRELTASEVAELARGNDLGFADEFGGALGGVYASTFAGTANGWGAVNGTVNHSTSIGGESNALSLTLNTSSSQHYLYKGSLFTTGKRYRLEADFYIPSTNSNMDGIQAQVGTSSATVIQGFVAPTLDTWNKITGEFIATAGSNPDRLSFYGLASASTTFADAGGDDVLYVRNVKVTEIGTLADFRSERYDTSTNKLYDISDNAFVGTGTSVTLTGREVPVYETGTWTPSLYFSGTSAATYSVQDGYYSRTGDTVYIRGSITLSGIGASSGAVSVAGLPFQPSGNGASSSVMPVHMTSALNLTSSPTGLVDDGVSQILLYDAGATGQTALDETNFGASTVLKIAGTYKIQ